MSDFQFQFDDAFAFGRRMAAAPQIVGDHPWMDAAFTAAAGIPTVMFGPGGEGAHATEEWVSIDDTVAAELMMSALAPLLGKHLILFVVLRDAELDSFTAAEPNEPDDLSRAITAAGLLRERRLVLMAAIGLFHVSSHALVQTVIQSYSPPEFRGRAIAMFHMTLAEGRSQTMVKALLGYGEQVAVSVV